MRRSLKTPFKRPLILPPLSNLESCALRPMDPLQPPDLAVMENRLGSPAPKSNIPHELYHDYNSNNGNPVGNPIIKITDHEADVPKEIGKSLVSEQKDFICRIQKRNPIKILGLDSKPYDQENLFFNNHSKNQFKNLHNESDKKLKCPPLEEPEETKTKLGSDVKVVQIPNRYAPLKPIGQRMQKNE